MDKKNTLTINAGVNWVGLSQYITGLALDKARREIKPDISPSILVSKRTAGVHQGAWEVIVKILPICEPSSKRILEFLNPSIEFIHEFDLESLEEYFGTKYFLEKWLSQATNNPMSRLSLITKSGEDEKVKGKEGDLIEEATFLRGREYGIGEALLQAYLIDPNLANEAMLHGLFIDPERIHPLTISGAALSAGGADSFRNLFF